MRLQTRHPSTTALQLKHANEQDIVMAMNEERIQTCLVRAAFGACSKAAPYVNTTIIHQVCTSRYSVVDANKIHTIVQQCAEIFSKTWAMGVLNVESKMGWFIVQSHEAESNDSRHV
jgi:hypothetical protein